MLKNALLWYGTVEHVCCPVVPVQHGHYTNKAKGMKAVRQFVPPNTLRWVVATVVGLAFALTHSRPLLASTIVLPRSSGDVPGLYAYTLPCPAVSHQQLDQASSVMPVPPPAIC